DTNLDPGPFGLFPETPGSETIDDHLFASAMEQWEQGLPDRHATLERQLTVPDSLTGARGEDIAHVNQARLLVAEGVEQDDPALIEEAIAILSRRFAWDEQMPELCRAYSRLAAMTSETDARLGAFVACDDAFAGYDVAAGMPSIARYLDAARQA